MGFRVRVVDLCGAQRPCGREVAAIPEPGVVQAAYEDCPGILLALKPQRSSVFSEPRKAECIR